MSKTTKKAAKKTRAAKRTAKRAATEPLGYFQHEGKRIAYSYVQLDKLYTPGFAARLRALIAKHAKTPK